MLHITNGDCAGGVLREAGFTDPILPWRDVLHEGPVPHGIPLQQLSAVRAAFLAQAGWGDLAEAQAQFAERDALLATSPQHDEVVLWFEHDLYDQLQLIQLLDWFADQERGRPRLSLICAAEYLGNSTAQRLAQRFPERVPVSEAQLQLAVCAWAAFRSPDPRLLTELLTADLSELPFLKAALLRHLQQFPSVENGLSRSERQALEVLESGSSRLGEVYQASHHRQEDPIFLGDTVFVYYLESLRQGPHPLVQRKEVASNWDDEWSLTETGRDVLEGRADRVRLCGIDRWLGGVSLQGTETVWRWDDFRQMVHQA